MSSDVDEWRAATVTAVMRQRPPWHAVLTDARQTDRQTGGWQMRCTLPLRGAYLLDESDGGRRRVGLASRVE
jgi:hypothetical protein